MSEVDKHFVLPFLLMSVYLEHSSFFTCLLLIKQLIKVYNITKSSRDRAPIVSNRMVKNSLKGKLKERK